MELAIYVTWGLSLGLLIFSAIYAWGRHRKTAGGRWLSALTVFTAGFFVAVWLFLLPQNYSQKYIVSDNMAIDVIMAALMSLLNTLQVFINDGSTETLKLVRQCAAENFSALQTPYTLYAGLLIVAAPILTFGNVLSLFKGFNEEIRFRLSRRKRVYIMSELNNMSITLARSIIDEPDKKDEQGRALPKKTVVFAGVDDDADGELISEAREMNAIVLKRAATDLALTDLKNSEIFLIGNDENENITQAAAITTRLNEREPHRKTRRKTRIFAFSHSGASGRVIDSLEYKNLPKVRMPENNADCNRWVEKCEYPPPDFRLRRVDIVRLFVWNEVAKMGFSEHEDDLSILIAGFGTYGLEFFKTMSWFCQLYGRRLEINIVDRAPDVGAVLNRHCPMITRLDGRLNCDYSVRCISDIDFGTNSFSELLNYSGDDADRREISERLRRTTHMIIALGDDNADIEAALYLRGLFDRIHMPKGDPFDSAEEKDYINKPWIYAVLYDDHLSSDDIINMKLSDYKNVSYSINFIGGLSAKYSYKTVCNEELEKLASRMHLGWNNIETGKKTFENIASGANRYEELEYYRLSSMAKAMYIIKCKDRLDRLPQVDDIISRNEHDRWTLYMCTEGYVFGKRADRSKVHPCITIYDKVPDEYKEKDDWTILFKNISK